MLPLPVGIAKITNSKAPDSKKHIIMLNFRPNFVFIANCENRSAGSWNSSYTCSVVICQPTGWPIQCVHSPQSSSAYLDESGQHETQIHIPAQGGQIKQQAVINQATCVPAKPQAAKASYMYMYALDRGSIAVTCWCYCGCSTITIIFNSLWNRCGRTFWILLFWVHQQTIVVDHDLHFTYVIRTIG